MHYKCLNGSVVLLNNVSEEEKRFFLSCRKQFRNNVAFREFEEVVFDFNSPIFKTAKKRKGVLQNPLYKACKDMWLRLGIKQGKIKNPRI